MTTASIRPGQAAPSGTVPTATPARFEGFTEREAELFIARRFAAFVARGLDCTTALLRAVRPEER